MTRENSDVDFVTYLTTKGLAARTVSEYDKLARRFERWCWAHRIDPATAAALQVVEWAETTPYSWSSRKLVKAAMRYYGAWVGRDDDLGEAIRVPRKPRPANRALSATEARTLRDAAQLAGGRAGMATLCGLYLAARRGEIARLRWDGWTGERFRWERPKTSDWLTVPVHPVLAAELERYRRRTGTTSEYLFPGDSGRPHVTETTVWQWVRGIGELAGVDVTPHQLRHTALTTAYDATKDLRAVQDLAGHRDPSVTAIYTRTTEAALNAAVQALDY